MPVHVNLNLERLKDYCEKEQFKGWDPYDGLNSRLFQSMPFLRNSSFMRLIWIQLFKKNPVNLRSIVDIRKDYNPKGLALFLNGYCRLYRMKPDGNNVRMINWLTEKIISLKTEGYSGACWGYNFDWQSRAFFQPRYSPTVVASSFIGYALLDAFEVTKNEEYKNIALSIRHFILRDLNRTINGEGDFAFYASQGRLIENGKLTSPIKDVNIMGNGPTMLANITVAANDLEMYFGGAGQCGKNGQGAPVSFGLPTCLVKSLTVGGTQQKGGAS